MSRFNPIVLDSDDEQASSQVTVKEEPCAPLTSEELAACSDSPSSTSESPIPKRRRGLSTSESANVEFGSNDVGNVASVGRVRGSARGRARRGRAPLGARGSTRKLSTAGGVSAGRTRKRFLRNSKSDRPCSSEEGKMSAPELRRQPVDKVRLAIASPAPCPFLLFNVSSSLRHPRCFRRGPRWMEPLVAVSSQF